MQNKPNLNIICGEGERSPRQNRIDFIIEKCGGNSLAHVLDYFRLKTEYFQLCAERSLNFYNGMVEISVDNGNFENSEPSYIEFSWQLLNDNKEAKLQDQTPETIEAIHKLISGE